MTSKPSILVVSNYNDFHSVRPEAEIFCSLAQLGYKITVMTYGGSRYAQRFVELGITVVDHHPDKKYDAKSISKIKDELSSGDYDVLHLYNNKAIINGLVAAKGSTVKTIGYRGSTLNFSWYNPFNYAKHLSKHLDYVICNSKGVADRYVAHPFFDGSKTVVINKGHDLDWYTDVKPRAIRSEFQIPEDTPIFILVATDRTMKGVKYLCNAVNLLPSDTKFHLFMIGGGMTSRKYEKILQAGPHRKSVTQLGHTTDALTYVAAADVFVLPSIKGESITKAVLEAMSLGVCPLITDIAGNAELVDHQQSGIAVKQRDAAALADGMSCLIADRHLVGQYGKAAKRRIQHQLSHRSTVEQYEQLYDKIMGHK